MSLESIELSLERRVTTDDLMPLLAQSHWAAGRGRAELSRMLEASPVKLGAWQGERLVGFARVLTDGLYRALIDDVIIDQQWRGRGLGSEMMRRLADRLERVEEVFLRCEEDLVPFYAGLGYQRSAVCLDLVQRAKSEI